MALISFTMSDDSSFWEVRWKENRRGWDLHGPHPNLAALMRLSNLKAPAKGWVPGCGSGHDAAALAGEGFEVEASDISPTAIQVAQNLYGKVPRVKFAVADLFEKKQAGFDFIFDRAMWCALPPGRQQEYLKACWENLRPDGLFCSIAFTKLSKEIEAGPPFEISKKEIEQQLRGKWKIVQMEAAKPPELTPFILEEMLVIARKQ